MKPLEKFAIAQFVIALFASMLVALPACAQMIRKGEMYSAPSITAEQAMAKVKTVMPRLKVGKSFVMTGGQGQTNLIVTLVLDGQVASWIRVNPSTGEILPRGMKFFAKGLSTSQEQATNLVKGAISRLEVGSVRLRRDGNWVVDMTLNNMSIACVTVSGIDGSVIPCRKGFLQEAEF